MISPCHYVFFIPVLAGLAALPRLIVPNLPDLTIRTRQTSSQSLSRLETLYVKGARQRTETVFDSPSHSDAVRIINIHQCDEKRVLHLNVRDKIYSSSKLDKTRWRRKPRPVSVAQASGAEVTVTMDTVDTGERRQYGHYVARHVKAEIRFEPGPGAITPASVEERDGWYLDVPGLGCRAQASQGILLGIISGSTGNVRDQFHVKRLRNAPRGYPIEETTVITRAQNTATGKTELLEISEAPLDQSLFELPTGYRRALRTGRGGADLTKPDTISNRLQHRVRKLTYRVRWLFRRRQRR